MTNLPFLIEALNVAQRGQSLFDKPDRLGYYGIESMLDLLLMDAEHAALHAEHPSGLAKYLADN